MSLDRTASGSRSVSGLVVATAAGATMRSQRPKPIHLLCGRAMTSYVLDALGGAGVRQAVVVTAGDGGRVSKRLLEDPPTFPVRFVEQKANLGPADAALVGVNNFDDFDDEEDLLIVPGDVPLLQPATVTSLLDAHRESGAACTILVVTADPTRDDTLTAGELRVTRDRRGRVAGVREYDPTDIDFDPDPDPDEGPAAVEVALGVLCIRRGLLAPAIRRSAAESIDGRVRLTDVVAVLTGSGHECLTHEVDQPSDLTSVNDRLQLAEAEAELRRRTNRYWLSMGVTLVDPDRTYIDRTVRLGTDVTIFPGTILQGATVIGDGCEIGPDTRLDRCQVGSRSRIEKTTASLATVGDDCVVGPFAVLSPGAEVGDGTTTGPFYAAGSGPQ